MAIQCDATPAWIKQDNLFFKVVSNCKLEFL